jgi:hypothetical protein
MTPGIIGTAAGLLLVALSASHRIPLLSVHWMLLGMTLAVCGYSAVQMAILARVFYNFIPAKTAKYTRLINYNRGVAAAAVLGIISLAVLAEFVVRYFQLHMTLSFVSEPVIIALYLLLLSFQTFAFTLLFEMIVHKNKSRTSSH